MTDSFDEEAEPAYTIDQYLEGIEEQELVISHMCVYVCVCL